MEDRDRDGIVDPGETDPYKPDTDGDGLQDGTEMGYTSVDIGPDKDINIFQPDEDPAQKTDPTNPDTDNDGLADGVEDKNKNGVMDVGETNPTWMLGDINGNDFMDLADAILAIKIAIGLDNGEVKVHPGIDADGDGRVGLAEVIAILNRLSSPGH